MNITRRHLIGLGGGAAALLTMPAIIRAAEPFDIVMQGGKNGGHVWFDPIGVHIQPGDSVRWINMDKGNSHTATAYHPSLFDHPRRMPRNTKPWDSDYLLPGENFVFTFSKPGIYDYYCIPHEAAGMVGRVVVGSARNADWLRSGTGDKGVPEAALNMFPGIDAILGMGRVSIDGTETQQGGAAHAHS